MRFSILGYFTGLSLISLTVVFLLDTRPSPVVRLKSLNTTLVNGESQLAARRFEAPEDYESWLFGETDDASFVNLIWFDPSAQLKEEHVQLLREFPNLRSVCIPCKIENQWLCHLEECENLTIVLLKGSHISDEALERLANCPSIKRVFLRETNVSADAKKQFCKSKMNRFVNDKFTQ